ncbi:hypothetical protein [uncultured Vibrio sp.]|uniref:hypothetical protein n=1 Tax=uncultured Vibrio sp. TaxID=114054 RepID=UPI0025F144D8|nr:hypothetical protein [uncultured Vibrio sp.]
MSKTPIEFVFLTFGEKTPYHSQLIYSMISLAAHTPVDRPYHFTIITDKPEFYQWLNGPFSIIEVSDSTLQTWRGPFDFFWRIKIESILEAVKGKQDHHCVYFDTDTIAYSNLSPMYEALDNGVNHMHVKEFDFHATNGRTGKKMKKHGLGKVYGDFELTQEKAMWNAGVVAISATNSPEKTLAKALVACDAMCEDEMERKLVEQFSLSLALQANRIAPATDWIRHYWGNKPQWNNLITEFFTMIFLKGKNFDEAIDLFKLQSHNIPDVVKETKLEKYQNSVSKRYNKLLGKNESK